MSLYDFLMRLSPRGQVGAQGSSFQPPGMSQPLPPQAFQPPGMSSPTPPQQWGGMQTGGNLPPQAFTPPQMSTPTPPQQLPPQAFGQQAPGLQGLFGAQDDWRSRMGHGRGPWGWTP